MAASSNTSRELKYDVFVSFRGEDTRNNFASLLHAGLCRRKIQTFIDYQLGRGEENSPAPLEAIERSTLSIVILSQNYASSSWCLDQLLKIMECKNTKGQIVLPVFYHVFPSDVRKQTGSYRKAFAEHENHLENTKVLRWRTALTHVANLSGWHLLQHDGPESELVEEIVIHVLKLLNRMSSSDLDGFIGIESRLKTVESLLCINMVDVCIIGIWGMGGIGKTTIARAMFDQIAYQFEGCCFLANVREESTKLGLNRLRELLLLELLEDGNPTAGVSSLGLTFTKNRLRRKKVLIVLDDIDNSQQLKFLAGNHAWFGSGSRIIITSRDKQVLMTGVDEMYELEKLNYHESLQLFGLSAFKQSHPTENFMELSSQMLYYAKGIPLALKVLGSFLFGRKKQDWESALKKLEKNPNMDVQNILRISYDGLDDEEKNIFLDIACFFKGEDKDHVIAILDGCSFSTEIGISVLIDKCLVIVKGNKLFMHDLIQEMGRATVRQESIKEPGKRSRLWEPQEICNLFKKNTGTQSIESISLDLSKISELHLSSDAFVRMHKLRLLKFYSSRYHEHCIENDMVHLSEGLEFLSDELRYLHWHRYPLESLPSKFNPENLVELDMHHSNIEYLWKDTQHLANLRRIDLSYSRHLIETPDLTMAPNLEILSLDRCSFLTKFPEKISWNVKELDLRRTAIEEVPSAIECLSKLDSLRLMNCTRLKNLPSSIRNLTSLTVLDLYGCSNFSEFPEISGDMKIIYLDETAIEELPSSVECLTKLEKLYLQDCRKLKRVSSSILKLKSLDTLVLCGCSKLDSLPEILETTVNLVALNLDGTAIKELPSSIEHLTELYHLSLANCKNIGSLPKSFFNLRSLSSLILSGWSGVDKLLENLPLSLLSGLCSLNELNLSDCDLLELPSALSCLSSLEHLVLNGNNFESLNLKPFSSLKSLQISYCKRLQSIQELPSPLHLTDLQAHECTSLETLQPSATIVFPVQRYSEQRFTFSNCFKMDEDAKRNVLADAQLRTQLMATNARGTAYIEDYFEWNLRGAGICICFPGSEIPKWFSHGNEGSSVTIKLPQHWCSSKFLGFALCVVVAFDNYSDPDFLIECKCNFETNEHDRNNIECRFIGFTLSDYEYKPRNICSDHVFVLYNHELYAKVVQRDDDDRWFSMYQACDKGLFEFYTQHKNCKVKKCGVYPLYLEEEQTGNVDNSNEAELVESGGNIHSDEEKEDPNSQSLKDSETNSESNALCLAQGRIKLISKIFLVGLSLFLFLWCFLGVATFNGFSPLLPASHGNV